MYRHKSLSLPHTFSQARDCASLHATSGCWRKHFLRDFMRNTSLAVLFPQARMILLELREAISKFVVIGCVGGIDMLAAFQAGRSIQGTRHDGNVLAMGRPPEKARSAVFAASAIGDI